jgi:Amt family ammonium transporter
VVAVGGYSFVVTLVLGFLVDKTIGFRISRDEEVQGVDETTHAETAYDTSTYGGGGSGGVFAGPAGSAVKEEVPA